MKGLARALVSVSPAPHSPLSLSRAENSQESREGDEALRSVSERFGEPAPLLLG